MDNHVVGDSVDATRFRRDRAPGIDTGDVDMLRPAIDKGHRGDLDDVVSPGIESGRLEVDGHEPFGQE